MSEILKFEIQKNKKPVLSKTSDKFTHMDMVEYMAYFLKTSYNTAFKYQLVLKEFVTYGLSNPDVIGFSNTISIMVECKRSYLDFKRDKKKYSHLCDRTLGNRKYYFFNTKKLALKCLEEVPEKWGVFYIDEIGELIHAKEADYCDTEPDEKVILLSVIRRLMTGGQIEKYLEPNAE